MRFNREIAVALKRLRAVDVDPGRSNQHEINGVTALRTLLGSGRREFRAAPWLRLADDGDHTTSTHDMTWYDSRERHESRTEWRLYYAGEISAKEGDLLALLYVSDPEQVAVLVLPEGSVWANQFLDLIGDPGGGGEARTFEQTESMESTGLILEQILDLLGWVVGTDESNIALDDLLSKFGSEFPSTASFSAYVRERTGRQDSLGSSLWAWMRAEEAAFKLIEEHLIQARLAKEFGTVEDFLSFSLSVQNRRKSRAGLAFENHLSAVFDDAGIHYIRGATIDGKRRPDFLFPGVDEYRDENFPSDRLTTLAAKTTCKDRWRQVLSEARRIEKKHLCTLEPAISADQLHEMAEGSVCLVVPPPILATYGHAQEGQVIEIGDFVDLVRARQTA